MRYLLYSLLCVVLVACLKRPAGIERPVVDETLNEQDGSGNLPLVLDPTLTVEPVVDDPCVAFGQGCDNTTTEPNSTDNTGDGADNNTDNNTNDDTDGDGSLTVPIPELKNSTLLSSVMLKATCNNCVFPFEKDLSELQCAISKGCSGGFSFTARSTSTTREDEQALCDSSSLKVGNLSNLELKCTFHRHRKWLPDYKKNGKIKLSKAIIAAQHLCVVTEDRLLMSSHNPLPMVYIIKESCDNLTHKRHKLALTFSW